MGIGREHVFVAIEGERKFAVAGHPEPAYERLPVAIRTKDGRVSPIAQGQ